MSEEIDILKTVCRGLEQVHIQYMLTGSLAANFYAVPRMTRDIDFVIEVNRLQVDKFLQIFNKDFYVSKEAIAEAIQNEGMFNIIHNNSVFKVDFIIRKDSIYRDTEFQRRRRVKLDGEQIWIVSPEDLVISKLFWAKDSLSELQIKDIENILSSIKVDEQYVSKWVRQLNLVDIYNRVKVNE